MTTKKSQREVETGGIILRNMALAFFACAYAEQAEERGQPLRGEIMDQLPEEIDPAAVHASRNLAMGLISKNYPRANMAAVVGESVEAATYLLWERVWQLWIHADEKGDRDLTPELFGHYCAMQAMGSGVGLNSFGKSAGNSITVPYVEFGSHSLERDYFTAEEPENKQLLTYTAGLIERDHVRAVNVAADKLKSTGLQGSVAGAIGLTVAGVDGGFDVTWTGDDESVTMHVTDEELVGQPSSRGTIQLVGCAEEGSMVHPVADNDANYWGIYLQAPGSDEFQVVADFYVKELAYGFIAAQVAAHGYTLDDKTLLLNQGGGDVTENV